MVRPQPWSCRYSESWGCQLIICRNRVRLPARVPCLDSLLVDGQILLLSAMLLSSHIHHSVFGRPANYAYPIRPPSAPCPISCCCSPHHSDRCFLACVLSSLTTFHQFPISALSITTQGAVWPSIPNHSRRRASRPVHSNSLTHSLASSVPARFRICEKILRLTPCPRPRFADTSRPNMGAGYTKCVLIRRHSVIP